jgi:hypothetical protein
MTSPNKKHTALAASSASPATVRIRYSRTHFAAGAAHPKRPGDEEIVPVSEARALRGYGIADIIDPPDLDARSVETPRPAERAPARDARPSSDFRFNAGGLLIVPDPKLLNY